jgi:hypothetical protein
MPYLCIIVYSVISFFPKFSGKSMNVTRVVGPAVCNRSKYGSCLCGAHIGLYVQELS